MVAGLSRLSAAVDGLPDLKGIETALVAFVGDPAQALSMDFPI